MGEQQPLKDGGSAERGGQVGSERWVQTDYEWGMMEPGRVPGLKCLVLQSQKKKRCYASLKPTACLGYSAAVWEWGERGLLVQCSGCGVVFVHVWSFVTACLWWSVAEMAALSHFSGFRGIPE